VPAKKALAAARSRCSLSITSTRAPARSIARYRYRQPPLTRMYVSSTYQLRPTLPFRPHDNLDAVTAERLVPTVLSSNTAEIPFTARYFARLFSTSANSPDQTMRESFHKRGYILLRNALDRTAASQEMPRATRDRWAGDPRRERRSRGRRALRWSADSGSRA
jgi:hypothetical protein